MSHKHHHHHYECCCTPCNCDTSCGCRPSCGGNQGFPGCSNNCNGSGLCWLLLILTLCRRC